jgi:TonB family protein
VNMAANNAFQPTVPLRGPAAERGRWASQMRLSLLTIVLSLAFVGCGSTPKATTAVKLRHCPEYRPAEEKLDDLIPTHRTRPSLPRQAYERGLSGSVRMAVWVTPTGSVEQVCVVESSPPRVFDAAAAQAIAGWTFKPKTVEGVPTAQHGLFTIDFKVQ